MPTRFLIIGFILFISCNQSATKNSEKKANSTVVVKTKPTADTTPVPDTAFLRKRLFSFFERHKNEDVFDTVDYTYVEYWGAANYGPYSVAAGHLFNHDQVHCIILFSDELSTKMYVYHKKNKNWVRIFGDTSLSEHADLELTDWNRDGTKDISYRSERSWSYDYELWLVDKSGEKLHYLSEFSDVLNPQYDTLTGYINSSYYHAANGQYRRYRFNNYQLQLVDGLNVSDNYTAKNDPHITVTYERNGKAYKTIKTGYADLMKYIPKRWKDDVAPFFSQ